MCASGHIAIDVRGLELLQARPGETYDDAWHRMKGKLGTGKHLDETTLYTPDAVVAIGGKVPQVSVTGGNGNGTTVTTIGTGGTSGQEQPGIGQTGTGTSAGGSTGTVQTNLFGGTGGTTPPEKKPFAAPPTSGLNLLGQVEGWAIGPATIVTNVSLKTIKMTGSQLQQLLKHLPDGVTYALELEKESQ